MMEKQSAIHQLANKEEIRGHDGIGVAGGDGGR